MSQHDVTAQVRVIVFVNGLWHWHFLAEHVVEIGHGRVSRQVRCGLLSAFDRAENSSTRTGISTDLLCGFGPKNGKEE